MRLLLTGALLLFSSSCLWAEEDPFSTKVDPFYVPTHVRVQVKLIETSQAELTKMTSNPKALQENLYTSVRRLMKLGEAKLIHESVVVARSGEKATIESICEMIYPTEYEPSGLGDLPKKLEKDPPRVRGGSAYYTAFETRNVGDTLEIEPTICNDPKYIDLRFAPERVMCNRFITYMTFKDQWGNADISFPEFYVQRVNTAITLLNKETRFISTYTPMGKNGKLDRSRKILVFVKATVIKAR